MKTTSKFPSGWYVMYTRPKNEKRVVNQLKPHLKTYLPLNKSLRQWSDRKKWIELPLFPSYVFVFINNSMDYHKALNAKGACHYISFGGKAARISEKEIQQIKFFTSNFDNTEVVSDIEVGTTRTIKYGPFTGYDCKVINYKGKDSIIVEIESLNRTIVATMTKDFLAKTISHAEKNS